MSHRLSTACLLLVLSTTSAAQECVFPVHPGILEQRQPDGALVRLRFAGDAFGHWYEDEAGFAVVATDAGYAYAITAADGSLVATNMLVGRGDPLALGVVAHARPTRPDALVRPANSGAQLATGGAKRSGDGRGGFAPAASSIGTVKNLVILLRFSNHGPSGQNRVLPPSTDVGKIMNQVGGDPTLAPSGSVRDHYLEDSYGQLTINSTVVGWIDVPNTETYYANGNSGLTDRTWELIIAGLNAADSSIDFTQFDQDGDGWIDAITFLHSGYGAEWGGNDQYGTNYVDRMWSHKWEIPVWTSAEGVKVSDYNISPGLWSTSGSAPGRIGVVCHELGHFFGMPDLYDTGGIGASSQGIGNWCLMAAGSWGFDNSQQYPSHMSAWCKQKLGWLLPQTILPGAFNAAQVELNPSVFKIQNGYPPGEYLLVENRQKTGFDLKIPQGGLAVWHVDEGKGSMTQNTPENDEGYPGQSGWPGNNKHYRIALLQADAAYHMEHNTNRGDSGDPYHGAGVSVLDNATTPNTRAYQGGTSIQSSNRLQGIANSSASMAFTLVNTTGPTITTASAPQGQVGQAYTLNLASSGGSAPKTWSEVRTAPSYTSTDLGTQAFTLGGTAQNWNADDNIWSFNLPFAFPYWDTQYTKIWVSSNGFIDLAPGDSEAANRTDWLRFFPRIAPLWEDLRTDQAGQNIFIDTSVSGEVRIRWAAAALTGGSACNFAVRLYSDGRIRFEYGSGNTGLTPTVGMSWGDSRGSIIPASHDEQTSLTNAHALQFTVQGSQIPPGLSLTSAGVLSGIPTQLGTWNLRVRVIDASYRYDEKTFTVSTIADCNGNGIPDATDISNGTSHDCNTNGVPDECELDSDGDGVPNACDGCPNDPLKTAPGVCGCGVADTDSDGDGTANCIDGCPNDPAKTAPGVCGCGVADTDSDGDGTPNCIDGCPSDPAKIAPGACGCGVADTDTDGDGTPNCIDGCPNDPLKIAPGVCGCGIADTDSDGDGTPNCTDSCPNDPLKVLPGACGCGVADTDTDGDGTPNCNDGCPNDPAKIAPGVCGCGVRDVDSDGDGAFDCDGDKCPLDPNKIAPGVCGCGVADTDSDGDLIADCVDNCPTVANPLQGDCDTDGIGDACEIAAGAPDCNANGIPDACEIASGSGSDVNANGVLDACEIMGTPFCFGDGAAAACPCANSGASGHGCANSIHATGALLGAVGQLNPDMVSLSATEELPTALSIFLQGNAQVAPTIFGDGLRCAGGTLKRIGVKSAVAGKALYPGPGDLGIRARSAQLGDTIPSGGTRYYQTYYRDPNPSFCPAPPGNTWNVTNGIVIVWP